MTEPAVTTEPDETPAAAVGRVVGGVALIILGGVIILASAAAFIGGAFIPAVSDWWDWLGDGLWIVGSLGLVIIGTGFGFVRRSRKARRAAEAAEAAAVMERAKVAAAMGEPFDEDASGVLPVKPPISGPTIT